MNTLPNDPTAMKLSSKNKANEGNNIITGCSPQLYL